MKINKKTNWIIDYIETNGDVDILNEFYVDAYVAEFKVKCKERYWGASVCPDLGRQMSKMYKDGLLERSKLNTPHYDLPNWVYVYRLSR